MASSVREAFVKAYRREWGLEDRERDDVDKGKRAKKWERRQRDRERMSRLDRRWDDE